MSAPERVPFTQWANVHRTERLISIEPCPDIVWHIAKTKVTWPICRRMQATMSWDRRYCSTKTERDFIRLASRRT